MWTALREAVAASPADERPATPPFAEVYRDHGPFVWRVLRRLGLREDEVEDAFQEVFLVVHRKLDGFEHRSTLRTWLYRITVRCAAHRRRRRGRHAPDIAAPEPAIDPVQADEVASRQAREELDEILDTLDDARRAVFVLYELEELTLAEVAATVGAPLQTVYSRLQSARGVFEAEVKRRRAKERVR